MNGQNTPYFQQISVGSILDRVHKGQIRLPRFQRKVAWNEGTSAMLIESVLKGDPVGLFLTLEIGREKKLFTTRSIHKSAPKPTHECEELLLDGQQRIMSLYRAVKDQFAKPFIVEFRQLDSAQDYEINVYQAKKLTNDEYKLPKGVTNYFFPARLLSRHLESETEAKEWIQNHSEKHELDTEKLRLAHWHIKTKFLDFQVPVIRLPETTSRQHAINIFMQMNRSVAKLSAFDIAVAQMDAEVQESLHDQIAEIKEKTELLASPGDDDAKREKKIGNFALRTFCLIQGKSPTEGSFIDLKFEQINEGWSKFESAIEQMNDLLLQEKVWDSKRLPSLVPLHVIVALFMTMKEPVSPDKQGLYIRILTKYLWRAFLSDHYSAFPNKKMKSDYDKLSVELNENGFDEGNLISNVPIFGDSGSSPGIDIIKQAGWPGGRDRVGRGIFILTLKKGSQDIATDLRPQPETIGKDYQYHHIYPKGYLEDIKDSFKENALNCMILKGRTNRALNDKAPSEYLIERVKHAKDIPLEKRLTLLAGKLKTHIIPIEKLLESKPKKDSTAKERQDNFRDFVKHRAEEIHLEIQRVYSLESDKGVNENQ